jgi:hypothetical protein
MRAKLFAAALGLALVLPAGPSSSHEGIVKRSAHVAIHKRDRYVVRTFAPPSRYARVVVRALFDSCWRYREILTAGHRELDRVWTCGNYVKPNADFDWGYGSSIADRAAAYGYPW